MIHSFIKYLSRSHRTVRRHDFQGVKHILGRVMVELQKSHPPSSLRESEFRVHSQSGEDGIIRYLINRVTSIPETFVEFGVEDYTEANTLFLLENDNWKGLIIDGSSENISSVKSRSLYWRHDLTAVSAFITRENIDSLLFSSGFAGEIGLLSIDIDGNDYWVWEAITVISPVIVIVEYNSLFGTRHSVTIPYDPLFQRHKAHFSNLYWGASLKALMLLGERKGYSLVGCNNSGNNAFFVRKDKLGVLRECSVDEGYVRSKFRDSRDENGRLTFLAGDDQKKPIADLEVFDVEFNQSLTLRHVFGLE